MAALAAGRPLRVVAVTSVLRSKVILDIAD